MRPGSSSSSQGANGGGDRVVRGRSLRRGTSGTTERKRSVRSDSGFSGVINPVPLVPSYSHLVATLVEDLAVFFDDGGGGLQRMVCRLPMLLDADRAYIGRISPDGTRFSVTQASSGDWPDLLGYTQSIARLPAFARGSLKSGVQGTITDADLFPFTPQQRKMICYAGLGATIVTPIPCGGGFVGALVVDMMKTTRAWEPAVLGQCRLLAEAVGARIALARMGDHLESTDHDPIHDMLRLNVLANIARALEKSTDPVATSNEIVELLSALHWVKSARLADARDPSDIVRSALAAEALVVRVEDDATMVGIPLIHEGERFGAYELGLVGRSLTDVEEQFLRAVQTFAGSAYASARRRARPRDETLIDALTGLLGYRSINEVLADAVHAAKSSGRPVSVWLVDIEGLDEINRTHGYAVGDDVVGYVGHTLGAAVTGRGTAGRIGGGVFLVVFAGMELEEASVGARMMVERIIKNAPGHLPEIATTIGVSAFPSQGSNHDDLSRMARMALYWAKNAGRNRVATSDAADPNWLRDAHASFVRIVSMQQLPTSMQQRLQR